MEKERYGDKAKTGDGSEDGRVRVSMDFPEVSSGVFERLAVASGFRQRLKGLLFSPPHRGVLMLTPCQGIHTVGMKEDLDVAFLDASGAVLAAYDAVPAGRHLSCRGATSVLERFSCFGGPWFKAGDAVCIAKRTEGCE